MRVSIYWTRAPLCNVLLVCCGSIQQACVAALCAMDPLEAPCSVPACKLWAILHSLLCLVVLLQIFLLRVMWAGSGSLVVLSISVWLCCPHRSR